MKINRNLDKSKLEQSMHRSIDSVLDKVTPYRKHRILSKKYITVFTSFVILITMSIVGLYMNQTETNNPYNPPISNTETLSTYQSTRLAEVSYISGMLISETFTVKNNTMFLSSPDTTEFEDSINEFNIYFDMLIPFLEDENFESNIEVVEGNEEYSTIITFTEGENQFTFYVNVVEEDLTGVLHINNLTLDVSGSFISNEEEVELKLKASNNEDYVEIEYKVESKNEIERKYKIKQSINNIETEKEIKVEFEETETKVEIKDNEDSYQLKKELEDGAYIYKLEYEVNGISGEVKIIENNIDGVITYTYIIEEDGKQRKEIELDKPNKETNHHYNQQEIKKHSI